MKTRILYIWLILIPVSLASQDVAQFTQVIMDQEYTNPAYNGYKNYMSMGAIYRNQWVGQEGAPETFAANFYVPIVYSRIGAGSTIVKESIGLREVINMSANMHANIKVSSKSYISVGLQLGLENTHYDLERARMTNGLDVSTLDQDLLLPTIGMGMFWYAPHLFGGVSSFSIIEREGTKNRYLPGFDVYVGGVYPIGLKNYLKPFFLLKEYVNVSSLYHVGVSLLVDDVLWVSTSHKFEESHTFSVDFKALDGLWIGYTFEVGIKGVANINNGSHGIRIGYDLRPKIKGKDRDRRHFSRYQYRYY